MDCKSDSSIAERTFTEFAGMSGLELNIGKTICIPLWESGVQDVQQTLRSSSRAWCNLTVMNHGTYLGFVEGPGKCHKGWDKPLKKYIHRCNNWSMIGGGLQYSTIAYNTFAASTLAFVFQLEHPPSAAIATEEKGIQTMLPGPGAWCSNQDAFFLKELYGQQKSFQSLEIMSQAAQLRVLHAHDSYRREHRNLGIPSVLDMFNELTHLLHRPSQPVRAARWKDWYESSHVFCLIRNKQTLETEGIHMKRVLQDIAGTPPPWDVQTKLKQKAQMQKEVTIRIKQNRNPTHITGSGKTLQVVRSGPYRAKSPVNWFQTGRPPCSHCDSCSPKLAEAS